MPHKPQCRLNLLDIIAPRKKEKREKKNRKGAK